MTDHSVLACRGGRDTPVAIGWIAAETGAEVSAVAGDVGQVGETSDRGVPVAIDGERVCVLPVIEKLNVRAGDTFDRTPAKDFGEPWGLPSTIAAKRDGATMGAASA